MPKRLFKSPNHLVKEWPEVFDDLYMNTMPIEYLDYVRLEFHNGRIWEIQVKDYLGTQGTKVLSDRLIDTFHEYSDDIKKIDFRIDIEQLKKDIAENTKRMLD